MDETSTSLVQPLAYRIWDPNRHCFFYTDVQPDVTALVDRWSGLFDKQGLALYENDIIRIHYNWKFGWVRALVKRHAEKHEYRAEATSAEGIVLHIGYYCFADSYRLGNFREHPGKLLNATEQFRDRESEPWWLNAAMFRSVSGSCFN